MVSIIIPYIDEHDYLAEALACAVGQQEIEAEIIVVCNAQSITLAYDPIPGEFKHIKFVHEPKSGSANARNTGLRYATGKWVQYLDVDDLLHPDKIHHQMNITDADVVVSPHTYLFLNGKKENSKWLPEDFWCGLLNSGLGSTSSMLWNRQALLDVNGWSTAWQSHQEYELLFRLAAAGKKIITNDHCETIVRQRKTGSITSTTKLFRVKEGIRLRETMWSHLKETGDDTPERLEAFRQYIFRQLRGLYRQDRHEANVLFEKYFSKETFTPKEIHVPGYVMLYKLLGFQQTESLIQFFISFRKSNLTEH
jgi:glycosyltransferase involved in cell wall biosynthesis